MKAKQAKTILHALAQGKDPETSDALPKDSVLDKPTVIRALLTGVVALESIVNRESRRATVPSNIGKTWSEEERQKLIEEFQSGKQTVDIAKDHGRTVRAIELRLEAMGLITPEQRTTKHRLEL